MHNGEYLLKGEFVALITFFFAPPLLIAVALQTLLFFYRGMFVKGRVGLAFFAYIATVIASLVIGAALHQLAPQSLAPILRVRDVAIGNQMWPVMPLAFWSVALAAIAVTWLVLSRERTLAKSRTS
jgi:hypothetical protein